MLLTHPLDTIWVHIWTFSHISITLWEFGGQQKRFVPYPQSVTSTYSLSPIFLEVKYCLQRKNVVILRVYVIANITM